MSNRIVAGSYSCISGISRNMQQVCCRSTVQLKCALNQFHCMVSFYDHFLSTNPQCMAKFQEFCMTVYNRMFSKDGFASVHWRHNCSPERLKIVTYLCFVGEQLEKWNVVAEHKKMLQHFTSRGSCNFSLLSWKLQYLSGRCICVPFCFNIHPPPPLPPLLKLFKRVLLKGNWVDWEGFALFGVLKGSWEGLSLSVWWLLKVFTYIIRLLYKSLHLPQKVYKTSALQRLLKSSDVRYVLMTLVGNWPLPFPCQLWNSLGYFSLFFSLIKHSIFNEI